MDIKNVLVSVLPMNLKPKKPVEKAIKSDSATDRDANGQQSSSEQQKKKNPMTPEELQVALDHLKNLEVVKNQNLQVELVTIDNKKFVIIKDHLGKVIRRAPELELWDLVKPEGQKGQLLSKAA